MEKVIKSLDFNPNPLARGLITRKSSIIGIIVPSITNWFFSSIVEDVEKQLRSQGYSMHLAVRLDKPQEEENHIRELEKRHIDGLIVIDPTVENLKKGFFRDLSNRLPLILISSYNKELIRGCAAITYDESSGMEKAIKKLKGMGKKKIALLRGRGSQSYDIREQLYDKFLEQEALSFNRVITAENSNSIEVIKDISRIIGNMQREQIDMPDAFIACNDLMASGLIAALKDRKIAIPREVAVIGYDNTPLCYLTSPRITTVDISLDHLGKKAMKELMRLIEDKEALKNNVVLETKLIVRESC